MYWVKDKGDQTLIIQTPQREGLGIFKVKAIKTSVDKL